MRDTCCEGGAHLSQVYRSRGCSRRDTGKQEQRRGGEPVSHTKGSVDELRSHPDERKDEQFAHRTPQFPGISYRLGRQCGIDAAGSTPVRQ
ncbi:hypothetical protein Sar04_28340 [Salinispora arenicola]|uniref:Uncharacterized protein n=1 Tax=Salinispora arenicola TaxID=168697 RepID=A0ABQ4JVG5_SALAC|nr:hypothetical protein Sar04_28340 [Salinispora arenicola]